MALNTTQRNVKYDSVFLRQTAHYPLALSQALFCKIYDSFLMGSIILGGCFLCEQFLGTLLETKFYLRR